jgi:hypothetical protein
MVTFLLLAGLPTGRFYRQTTQGKLPVVSQGLAKSSRRSGCKLICFRLRRGGEGAVTQATAPHKKPIT